MQRENDNSYAQNLCDRELQATSCVTCHPAGKKPVPGLPICRFGPALNYANAGAFEDFLSEFGILTAFGTDRIFRSIAAAITAYQGLISEAPHGSAEPVTNRAPAYSKW